MADAENESEAERIKRDRETAMREPTEMRSRLFEPLTAKSPFGAASISLLLHLLVDRTKARAWSIQRQRVHARALLELSCDHYFTDEELQMLAAFVSV